MKLLDKINDKTFDDVICYVIAEPGAMGEHCTIECMTSRREVFAVHYDFEETSSLCVRIVVSERKKFLW